MGMSDIQAVSFHTLRDNPFNNQPQSSLEYWYGFLRPDWTPKPVYCYFATASGHTYTGC
jgi:hypothetical protein